MGLTDIMGKRTWFCSPQIDWDLHSQTQEDHVMRDALYSMYSHCLTCQCHTMQRALPLLISVLAHLQKCQKGFSGSCLPILVHIAYLSHSGCKFSTSRSYVHKSMSLLGISSFLNNFELLHWIKVSSWFPHGIAPSENL